MSYIEGITREEYLQTIENPRTRESNSISLKQFDIFCETTYGKTGDKIITDLKNHIKEKHDDSNLYRLLQSFVTWLSQDHPELEIKFINHSRPMRKRSPGTIKNYITCVKSYIEEFGDIDFVERKYQRRVKVPKKHKEELEPFLKSEIRQLCDISTFNRKTLYMTLKDSGMRIGEACQIRKKHINFNKDPVEISLPAIITKTKTARTTFVTRETVPLLKRKVANLEEEDLVFGDSENIKDAILNEEVCFSRFRKKAGLIERYESNNRHKKNLHSLRAFTATQIADKYGEEFAHGFIGHSKFLGQYIRRNEKIAQMYKKIENKLMIYEQEIIVENTDSEVEILKKQVQKLISETIEQKEQLEIRNKFLENKLEQTNEA